MCLCSIGCTLLEGGAEPMFGEHPWTILLDPHIISEISRQRCGEVIITNRWILTAASLLLGRKEGAESELVS